MKSPLKPRRQSLRLQEKSFKTNAALLAPSAENEKGLHSLQSIKSFDCFLIELNPSLASPSPLIYLPNELLLLVFSFVQSSVSCAAPPAVYVTPLTTLTNCARVCKDWNRLLRPLIYRTYYASLVQPYIGILPILKEREWQRVCFLALASLYSRAWAVGGLRLFYIQLNDMDDLDQKMEMYPNPAHPFWSSFITCTLDVRSMFIELASAQAVESLTTPESSFIRDQDGHKVYANEFTAQEKSSLCADSGGQLIQGQDFVPMMLRSSEKMDLGSFLIYYRFSWAHNKSVVLRVKPVGWVTDDKPLGDEKLVIWDSSLYGRCTVCKKRLDRVQVCADCRVAQYCSRECQKQDWSIRHRNECKKLAFHPNSVDDFDDELMRVL